MTVLKKNIIRHTSSSSDEALKEVSNLEQVFNSTFLSVSTIRKMLALLSSKLLLFSLSESS